jgi:hypothetical protein
LDTPLPFSFDDTWNQGFVELSLSCEGFIFSSELEVPKEKFHTFPFKAYWKLSSGAPGERIYSEVYTGDAWNSEYEKIQEYAQYGPNCYLERFIISLLLWSDSTCLA